MGVFIYRSADGKGSINWQDITLRWMYRQSPNAVHDTMTVSIQVFAIEMVYIPQGSFYLGDGNMSFAPSSNSFRVNNQAPTIPKGNEAYLVQSEDAITFVNSSSTSLTDAYDPTTYTSSDYTLPASFPKGYTAFYCMKYEISQKQYVDFFNTLNAAVTTQKSNRNLGNTGSYRNNFSWSGVAGVDATLSGSVSGDRAQNYINWADGCAYADWAALRPMSEMEYEKVCRGNAYGIGPIYPVNLEYAWGNTVIKPIFKTLVNDGLINERLGSGDTSNCNYNNTSYAQGPVRVGIFAAKNPTSFKRRATGASYYGVMELSGNLSEPVVSTFIPYGYYSSYCTVPQPAFSRNIHGDGLLNTNGNCDIPSWSNNPAYYSEVTSSPSYGHPYNSSSYCYGSNGPNQAAIAKLKGGSWGSTSTNYLRTSDRSLCPYVPSSVTSHSMRGSYSTTSSATSATNADVYQRNPYQGFRCVRTVP